MKRYCKSTINTRYTEYFPSKCDAEERYMYLRSHYPKSHPNFYHDGQYYVIEREVKYDEII